MAGYAAIFVFFAVVGWLLAKDRQHNQRQRLIVALSAPLGILVGGELGGEICYQIMSLHGKGNSHNDMVAIAGASIMGSVVGAIVFFVSALWITRQRKRSK
jgi:predicted membrane protein